MRLPLNLHRSERALEIVEGTDGGVVLGIAYAPEEAEGRLPVGGVLHVTLTGDEVSALMRLLTQARLGLLNANAQEGRTE